MRFLIPKIGQSVSHSLLLTMGLTVSLPLNAQEEQAKTPGAAENSETGTPAPAKADDSGAAQAEGQPAQTPAAQEQAADANEASYMDDSSKDLRIQALRQMITRYESQMAEFREDLRMIADRKYLEQKRAIEEKYEAQLEPVLARERQYRLDAIAAFERFLERHPKDREFTPDALFRLAELYFERHDDNYQQEMAVFRKEYEDWVAAGSKGDMPAEPRQDFSDTIATYQRLVRDFPNYKRMDGVYYLLGYSLEAQGEPGDGMESWRALVDNYPDSQFYAEVWFRIADFHFDEEEWDEALAGFLKVVPIKDSPYQDKALYKLGWTYYLVNRFDDAVVRFFELLDSSYAKKAAGEDTSGSVLEEEAIQYVAISFSEDNWERPEQFRTMISGEGPDDPFAEYETDYVAFAKDYFQKAGERPFQRDVIAAFGDILFQQSRHMQAIEALRWAISLDPYHRDAPQLQDLIVQSFERERMFEEASVERDILVSSYQRGTEWFAKNQNDSDAVNKASELARIGLYKAAIYYHQQGNKYFEDEKEDLGVKYMGQAAGAYRQYLELYPHDKEAYELSFYLAETLYYSLKFADAYDAYKVVRDTNQGSTYRGDAAVAMVYSLEKVIAAAEESGELEKKDFFGGGAKDEAGEKILLEKPLELPPLRAEMVSAIDEYIRLTPNHEQAPPFAYQVAAIRYVYGYYDEAMERFENIIKLYPEHEAARFAANYILDYLLAKKDWVAAAKYAKRFMEEMKDDESGTFAKIEGGARFQIATQILEKGEIALKEGRVSEGLALLEDGADRYLELLAEDPQREFADIMMYNAALSLEKAKRPAKAAELYERLYKEYPKSSYAAEAMFRVASKSEQSFRFKKAVRTYLNLVKTYPESDKRGDAQINAALALEGQQKYAAAAKEFERFSALFPERPEAPEVFFRAAMVQKKAGNDAKEIDTLNRFISKFRSDSTQIPRVVEAYVRIGDIEKERQQKQMDKLAKAKKRKDKKRIRERAKRYDEAAFAAWKKAVDEQKKVPDSPTAGYYAAKASFYLAEEEFAQYETMNIEGSKAKAQGEALVAKTKRLTEVQEFYKGVITTYKQAEWSLASLYRIGALYDGLQKSIFAAPCPKDIARIDEIACDEYATMLEDKAYAVEEKAVEAYRVAYERANELKLTNVWTKKTLEALNLLRSSDYPIDKEPLVQLARGDIYNLGMVYPDGGAQEMKAAGYVLGADEPEEGASEESPDATAEGESEGSPDAEASPGAADAQGSPEGGPAGETTPSAEPGAENPNPTNDANAATPNDSGDGAASPETPAEGANTVPNAETETAAGPDAASQPPAEQEAEAPVEESPVPQGDAPAAEPSAPPQNPSDVESAPDEEDDK